MNKNLMAIFRKDGEFKQNDLVYDADGKKKYTVIEIYTSALDDKIAVLDCGWKRLELTCLTLITPFVPLYEVLEKLRIRLSQSIKTTLQYYGDNKVYLQIIINNTAIEWRLSDKSGEVPLHRQSKETISAIGKILDVK